MRVWKIPLEQPPEVVAACRRLLNAEEQVRADGLHAAQQRRRWAVSRASLRLILARELGDEARAPALRFEVGPNGKPGLAPEGGVGGAPQFNLSHCDDLALVAVAGDRPVGVDVERIRPLSELRTIVERYFSPEERAYLAAGAWPDPPAARGFFTLWTRREAATKALGFDLQAALAGMRLPVYEAGQSAALGQLGDRPGPWWLGDLVLGPEHVGALCVRGEPAAIVLEHFRPSDFPRLL